jgi:flagellar basal body-associated protein FliL
VVVLFAPVEKLCDCIIIQHNSSTVIVIIVIIIIITLSYITGFFFSGATPLQPVVNTTTQASSFKL